MKHFIIEEKFTGYANIYIEAETKEDAMNRYRSGDYKDSSYDIDDMFYDYEFCSINEENDTLTNCQVEDINSYGMGIEFTIQDTSELFEEAV